MAYEIQIQGKSFLLDNRNNVKYEIERLTETTYHIILNNNSYKIDIKDINMESGELVVRNEHREFSARLISPLMQKIAQMGLNRSSASLHNTIKAPMPGLVIKILVNEGDSVQKGDSLLTLEAMKMENVIKAPHDGKIKKIEVKAQQKIEKNQPLIEFE